MYLHVCIYVYVCMFMYRYCAEGGKLVINLYIRNAVAIQHPLKYTQIKFYKESNQIKEALFSSIAIYKRTDS